MPRAHNPARYPSYYFDVLTSLVSDPEKSHPFAFDNKKDAKRFQMSIISYFNGCIQQGMNKSEAEGGAGFTELPAYSTQLDEVGDKFVVTVFHVDYFGVGLVVKQALGLKSGKELEAENAVKRESDAS